jgi:hypothetical protein
MGAENNSDRATDQRIIQTILRTIEEGRAPPILAEKRDEFAKLIAKCESGEYGGDLWELMNANPEIGADAIMITVRKSLDFVRDQASKYAAIKSQRALSEAEKRYGNEILLPLLESLSLLLSRVRGKKREGSGDG